MKLVTVQEYATRYNVSRQSVYARIRSGAIIEVIKDGIKYVEDNIEDISNNNSSNDKETLNGHSIEIQYLKKEIKRLKKDLKKSEKKRDRSDDRIDELLNLFLNKKELSMQKESVIDVALVQKKKKKKKKK